MRSPVLETKRANPQGSSSLTQTACRLCCNALAKGCPPAALTARSPDRHGEKTRRFSATSLSVRFLLVERTGSLISRYFVAGRTLSHFEFAVSSSPQRLPSISNSDFFHYLVQHQNIHDITKPPKHTPRRSIYPSLKETAACPLFRQHCYPFILPWPANTSGKVYTPV